MSVETRTSLRSLHSLSGVFPLGVSLLLELWLHARALAGPDAYRGALALTTSDSAVVLGVVVLVPLSFHAGYGLWLVARARYTVGRYPSSRNWMYTLQRATGVMALAFVVYHGATFWWPLARGAVAPADAFAARVAQLSTTRAGVPWIAFGYLIGLAALAFHLFNGLWSFGSRWGLWVADAAKRRAGAVLALCGAATFLFGAHTVVYLATGWRVAGGPAQRDVGHACPVPDAPVKP